MNRKINILEKLVLAFWLLLTIIIIYFIIQRFINPSFKGISNMDLKIYLKISIVTFILILILKKIKKNTNL